MKIVIDLEELKEMIIFALFVAIPVVILLALFLTFAPKEITEPIIRLFRYS